LFGLDQLFVQLSRLLIDMSKQSRDTELFSAFLNNGGRQVSSSTYIQMVSATVSSQASIPGDLLGIPILLMIQSDKLFAGLLEPIRQ